MASPCQSMDLLGQRTELLKKPMAEIREAEYDAMTAVNARTTFFFLKEAGKNLNDNGKICTVVTSLLGAFTPFYAAYAGTKAPVEHYTRAASKELGARGISVTAVGPGPMDTPFFYPAEVVDAVGRDHLRCAGPRARQPAACAGRELAHALLPTA